jgi:hypothetical protein
MNDAENEQLFAKATEVYKEECKIFYKAKSIRADADMAWTKAKEDYNTAKSIHEIAHAAFDKAGARYMKAEEAHTKAETEYYTNIHRPKL